MNTAIIGLGLIGGSFGLHLKQAGLTKYILGVDTNPLHCEEALRLNIADEIASLKEAVGKSELIILATPVDVSVILLPAVLDLVTNQVVMDAGSTKAGIAAAVKGHPKRGRFVATHPIWGTEYSGPTAAKAEGMAGKVTVFCDIEESDTDALLTVENLYNSLGMKRVYMDSVNHDLHAAYISHISHITSFALALSVLEKEKEEDKIFRLAGGGFESTVRLAKSNPDTWVPIFRENRSNVLDVLNEQIYQLKQFKKLLELGEYDALHKLITQANEIKRIIK